jgi:hypothetical protein
MKRTHSASLSPDSGLITSLSALLTAKHACGFPYSTITEEEERWTRIGGFLGASVKVGEDWGSSRGERAC